MINIKSDSRKVKDGDIFVALKGISSNGDEYVESAIEKGASKIITETNNTYSVETINVEDSRIYLVNYLKDNYAKYLDEDSPNNLFFTTNALRDYHYTKQKNNAYYHIDAINLPFQNIEFYYIGGK